MQVRTYACPGAKKYPVFLGDSFATTDSTSINNLDIDESTQDVYIVGTFTSKNTIDGGTGTSLVGRTAIVAKIEHDKIGYAWFKFLNSAKAIY